jgi:hypothetical protein
MVRKLAGQKFFPVATALTIMMLACGATSAGAAAIQLKSFGAGTFVSADFSIDGNALGAETTLTSADNLEGASTTKIFAEYVDTGNHCKAIDNNTGELFNLVRESTIVTYTKTGEQIFSTTNHGSECISLKTFAFSGTNTGITTIGGTGNLAGAHGTAGKSTFAGILLSPSTAASSGFFGTIQVTFVGAVTP